MIPRTPIFIGGCERSGTTMLGSYLGKHPALLVTPESLFKTELMRRMSLQGALDTQATVAYLRRSKGIQLWEIPLDKLESALQEEKEIGFQKLMDLLLDLFQENMGFEATSYWVDHTPHNMRLGIRLSQLYPEAKFIHIVRDGRGVAYSYRGVNWGPYETYYSAKDWVYKVGFGLALAHQLGPKRVLLTRYEDILAEPAKEISRICSFLGLDYEILAAGQERFQVPFYSKQQHALVGKGLKKENKDRWRKGLSKRDLQVFESVAMDFLPSLGYSLLYEDNPIRISLGSKIIFRWKEDARNIEKHYKKRKMERRIRREMSKAPRKDE
ncbi:sulfotransferase [Clostridia bacterium]|nr:sulfotransferase [Clostridia bacterium]